MPRRPVSELSAMLAGMAPVLHPDPWRFVLVDGDPPTDAFALIREDEGVTAIVAGPGEGAAFARITLMVHSALDSVGLTAAVSGTLGQVDIACNIVAGYHHDHLFVPWARRDAALAVLRQLATSPS